MERTKKPLAERIQQLQILSALVSRAGLASQLGIQQYGGDRNIYEALGYKLTIEYVDYLARYQRQDIATAVIDRPVQVTWRGDLQIVETDDDEETLLEKEWEQLDKRLGLKTRFARLDRLTGIGRYGVLLLGLDDVKKSEDLETSVNYPNRKLLYVKPFGEGDARISRWEARSNNERYGLPTVYEIEMASPSTGVSSSLKVHHSRVIHVIDNALSSEVYGTPRLEAVFNRLMDLEKLVGGDAEMFWRGARPGYGGKLDENFIPNETFLDGLQDQLDEFEHNLRRVLITEGYELKALAPQISDPEHHVDIMIQMISAVTNIPKRILTGSERGELSSAQDRGEWLGYVQARREEYAEGSIVRPFVDRCIKYGILPQPTEDYSVKWEDLFALSEAEKIEIGKSRSTALKEYTSNPMAETIVPPDEYLQYFLGLTKEDIEIIQEARKQAMLEEEREQVQAREQGIVEEGTVEPKIE